jgi:hypothetical protein
LEDPHDDLVVTRRLGNREGFVGERLTVLD